MDVNTKPVIEHTALIQEAMGLERNMWRSWRVLVGMILLTMVAFATDVLPGMELSLESSWWAWEGTDRVLRGGMILAVLALTGYLTHKQRVAIQIRRTLHDRLLRSDSEVRRNHERLGGMLEMTRAMASEVDPQAIFDRMAAACRETFGCDQVSLMLLNRESGQLEVRAADGHENVAEVQGQRIQIGEGIAGWVAKNRKPILLGKSQQIRARFGIEYDSTQLSAAMIVPIVVRDELVGVINVSSRDGDTVYMDDDLQALLVFAEQTGVAIRHTEQTTWLRETLIRLDTEAQAAAARLRVGGKTQRGDLIDDIAA